jgi:hypothetical protein
VASACRERADADIEALEFGDLVICQDKIPFLENVKIDERPVEKSPDCHRKSPLPANPLAKSLPKRFIVNELATQVRDNQVVGRTWLASGSTVRQEPRAQRQHHHEEDAGREQCSFHGSSPCSKPSHAQKRSHNVVSSGWN